MSQSPAEIEADIERQREQLAATIDELQMRVKSTAVHQAKIAGLVAGAAVVVLVGVALVRRVRH